MAVCSGCGGEYPRREMVYLHVGHHVNLVFFHGDRVCRPCAMRACVPASGPYSSTIRSENPFITFVVWANPGVALTMPCTINQALTRSRSPSSRLRLLRTDRAVERAAS